MHSPANSSSGKGDSYFTDIVHGCQQLYVDFPVGWVLYCCSYISVRWVYISVILVLYKCYISVILVLYKLAILVLC